MKCYYNNPSATHATLDKDHWNHTGDLATMDEEGYFKIVGRLKDMVIRGGENIYPREIEEFLHHHEKISDVYVVGVPDIKLRRGTLRMGEDEAGPDHDRAGGQGLLQGKDRPLQDPAVCRVRQRFPHKYPGKIQKYLMREESIKKLGLEEAENIKTA